MNTRIFIIRHAEAYGNVLRVFHGWTDSKITNNGHAQAKKLAQRLRENDFDVIVSSPITRAYETAEYIAAERNIEILKLDGLKEINGGDWENLPWIVLPEKWPEAFYTWDFKPHIHEMPNGESMMEFQARLICAIDEIIEKNAGKNICVVTHGTAIKAMMCYFKGLPLEEMLKIPWCENTAITVIEHSENGFEVVSEGDDAHLDDSIATVRKQGWAKELEQKIFEMSEVSEVTVVYEVPEVTVVSEVSEISGKSEE